MVQRINVLDPKPDDLNLFADTLMMKRYLTFSIG